MRSVLPFSLVLLFAPAAAGQQVVDRIVATVEGDPITLSEVRELGRFQQLAGGTPGTEEELLTRLIEQWVVATEAGAARFARAPQAEIKREAARLRAQFASSEAYRARLRELGLNEAAMKRLVERQIYLARYLDYKFRPAVQVEPGDIEKYYRETLAPQLAARRQALPPLDAVQEQIRELLTQREISARAGRWLDESKARLKIEMRGGDAKK